MQIKKNCLIYRLYKFTFLFENECVAAPQKKALSVPHKIGVCRLVRRLVFGVPFSALIVLVMFVALGALIIGLPAVIYFIVLPNFIYGATQVVITANKVGQFFSANAVTIINVWATMGTAFLIGILCMKLSQTETSRLVRAWAEAKHKKWCPEVEFIE